MLLSMQALPSLAAPLSVHIVDPKGRAAPDIAVVVSLKTPASLKLAPASKAGARTAVMDQIDRQFVPRLLVVQTGTTVTFPNNDSVSHQVYSFSTTKRFQLALYRGRAHQPVVFERPGLVVLGCNIHDSMIGYIYITDSPYFGKTDAQGRLTLNGIPEGDYEVTLWSPRLNEPQTHLSRPLTIGTQTAPLELKLTRELQTDPTLQRGHDDTHY